MIKFHWFRFNDLTLDQLYSILELRSATFVVEQRSIYLDPDGLDKFAFHLLGLDNGSLAAYLRLLPPTDLENYLVFGRVVISKAARSKGYGKQLMNELLNYCNSHFPKVDIKCSAQNYLVKFYEGFGFKTYGDVYDDEGVPHIDMIRKVK